MSQSEEERNCSTKGSRGEFRETSRYFHERRFDSDNESLPTTSSMSLGLDFPRPASKCSYSRSIAKLRDAPARIRFLSVEPLIEHLGPLDLRNIDWVIVGGESGSGARPMATDCGIVRQTSPCTCPGSAILVFKQWGGVHKSRTGRLLEGRTYDDLPTITTNPVPSRRIRLSLLEDPWNTDRLLQKA